MEEVLCEDTSRKEIFGEWATSAQHTPKQLPRPVFEPVGVFFFFLRKT